MNDPVAATLAVIADHVERYRQQLADVGPLAHRRPDVRTSARAVDEAERALRNAERLLRTGAQAGWQVG